MYDYLNNTCEGLLLAHYGVEGHTYTVDGAGICAEDGIDPAHAGGVVVRTDNWDSYATGNHQYNHHAWYTRMMGYAGSTQWEPNKSFGVWRGPGGAGTGSLIRMYKEDVFAETQAKELRAQYKGAMDTIHGEFMYKVMTTDMDLDAEWPKYINQLNAAGLTKVNDELNKLQYTVDQLNSVGVTCGDSGCVAN